MGLNETLNTDLTPTKSNNIDVHMMRSTEYGAMAILSASGYGNPQTLQNSSIKTTTGNKTGIYIIPNNYDYWEAVAGSFNSLSINTRYWDKYTSSENSAKVGDALGDDSVTNPRL